MRVWIAIRFTKDQFKEIFGFSVENCQEEDFTRIEDKYFVEIDFDDSYVYIGEELHDEDSIGELNRAIGYISDISMEIEADHHTSGKTGLHMFNSSWR